VEFDTSTPDFVVKRTVTGVAAGTRLEAIDLRPSNGKIYGVARVPASVLGDENFYTYEIDPDTAIATLKGGPAVLDPGNNGLGVGMDFDPVADQIRLVTAGNALSNENGRINPDTGALVMHDTGLTPTPVEIRGIAYDRSDTDPATATTLYGIDKQTSSLVMIGGVDGTPSPSAGAVTALAPLGVTFDSDPGFDISPQTGVGYASLGSGVDHRLYRIPLTPGPGPNAALVGDIDDGDTPLGGLTILPGDGPKKPADPGGGGGDGEPATCAGKNVTIPGTVGDDSLKGTTGADVIAGGPGRDKIVGRGGNDIVCGGDGNDNINGSAGKDKLYGNAGKDKLNGSGGKGDLCNGGAGKDKSTKSCEKTRSA
jgi:Ca2+-binding RTX toxin-like protein